MGLGFGTKLTTGTMEKGMLVMINGYSARHLGLDKTIGVIEGVHPGEPYPCMVKPIWSSLGLDGSSMIATKPLELMYLAIVKEKNKRCPSSIFESKPKTTSISSIVNSIAKLLDEEAEEGNLVNVIKLHCTDLIE